MHDESSDDDESTEELLAQGKHQDKSQYQDCGEEEELQFFHRTSSMRWANNNLLKLNEYTT